MKSTKLLALMMALSLFACRSGGNDDDDDGDDGGDDGSADDTAIQDIQSDDMPDGTPVNPRGVVVVAVDTFGVDVGKLFVMEPEGGPYSGVLVFDATGVEDLNPGDIVDVVGGVKVEFALPDDSTGRTVTEISPPEGGGSVQVTKVGDGDVPEPESVLPWELAADDAESEQWEGVLIRFENVRVLEPLDEVGDDATRQRTEVTGPYDIQSDLTSFEGFAPGNCYTSLTGIGDYFFSYKILPRSVDDIVAGEDADCLPAETTDELCGDDVDNDYNGFADCEDFSCADAAVACPTTETSVVDIQAGEIAVGTEVLLSGVVVTGVSRDNPDNDDEDRTVWVQDAAAGAENNGTSIYWPEGPAGPLPPEVVVGATLDVRGTVSEFDCASDACADDTITQLTFATFSNFGETVETTPLEGVPLATLATDPDSEPYEGVLVTIENVAVVTPPDDFGLFVVGDGTSQLAVDADIFEYPATDAECLASVTGIMHRDVFGGALAIEPRSADDVITGRTCD